MFLESSGKVTPGFPDINLPAFIGNAINSCTCGEILLVLVRLKRAVKFLGSRVVDLDPFLPKDTLETMGGGT